jgi:ribosomal protein S12 methylthiotransferase accessory factor
VTSVADAYRAALPGEVEQFPISGLDRLGVPAWNATAHGPPAVGGTGYGGTDDEALAGTYGELTEEYRSWLTLHAAPRRQASYAELLRERGPDGVQDPRTLSLPAGAAWDEDRPLRWLPARRLRDGAEVLVPAELVASNPHDLPGDPPPGGWLTVPVTNGLGAGLDPDRALAHALLEILQRDGDGLTFRALDRGAVLDLDGLADPVALDVLARLRAAGVEPLVKLAATAFGIPVVHAVGAAPDDGILAATACGEAAHPDRELAVRKALLEFAAARARKLFTHGPLDAVARVAPPGYLDRAVAAVDLEAEEGRVLDAMVAWLRDPEGPREALEGTVFSRRSTARLADLPTAGGEPLPLVLDRLAADGLDVLVADLSGDGVHAVKALVPGLDVETVAYGRIGERGVRRARELAPDLVGVGPPPPGGLRVHLPPEAEERLGGAAWLDPAAVERVVDGLLPLYREPGRHAAQVALARGAVR